MKNRLIVFLILFGSCVLIPRIRGMEFTSRSAEEIIDQGITSVMRARAMVLRTSTDANGSSSNESDGLQEPPTKRQKLNHSINTQCYMLKTLGEQNLRQEEEFKKVHLLEQQRNELLAKQNQILNKQNELLTEIINNDKNKMEIKEEARMFDLALKFLSIIKNTGDIGTLIAQEIQNPINSIVTRHMWLLKQYVDKLNSAVQQNTQTDSRHQIKRKRDEGETDDEEWII